VLCATKKVEILNKEGMDVLNPSSL